MFKSFKKVISTLAAVAILASSASAFAVTFPDVDESASYANAVNALTNLGIVDGDDNGKFNPDNTVTRAEFTKMVVEAKGLGDSASSSTYTQFTDAQGHWAAGYVQTGVAEGFINGYDEKTFGPDDKVTYAQAVKMLVAGIGYELWSQEQGGYPAGYLSWGSQLDIIDGVKGVNNDTALTRAQCAVLIYNTLKAPVCEITTYDKDYQGNYYPKYDIQNGEGKGWKTLLTEKHDAYVVKGRVSSLVKNEDKVKYDIELAENFDGYVVKDAADRTANKNKEMNIGNTNAVDTLYEYTEAVVQKDTDKGEYTLISIVKYGSTKTVEFAASDLSSAAGPIEVKREGTNYTDKYDVNDGNGTANGTEVYINGERIGVSGTASATGYSWNFGTTTNPAFAATNYRGTITLIDETKTASTTTDGVYDRIMITSYASGKVESVKVKNDIVKINTDGIDLSWDLTDETINAKFYKDGEEISYEDLKEDDVILVQKDSTNKWYDVYVSDATVSGLITRDRTDGVRYVTIDSEEYAVAGDYNGDTLKVGSDYTLKMDALGFAYSGEENETNKNIGIIENYFTPERDEQFNSVSIITSEGNIEVYELKDAGEVATVNDMGLTAGATASKLRTASMTPEAEVKNRIIEYTVTGGKLRVKKVYNGSTEVFGSALATANQFHASTSKLDNYTVSEEATSVIDLDAYFAGQDPVAFTYDSFEDEVTYGAFVCDRNSKGVYRFAVLVDGSASLRATSALAVVTKAGSTSQAEDGTNVSLFTVARNGEEDIEIMLSEKVDLNGGTTGNGHDAIKEGTIIMYRNGSEGYIDALTDIKIVHTPYLDYSTMMNTLLAQVSVATDFTSLAGGLVTANGSTKSGYDLGALANSNNDVSIYYGPVYRATSDVLEIFTDMSATEVSNVNANAVALTLAGANVYTFNYDAVKADGSGYGTSVEVSKASQTTNAFKNMYISATDDANIDWNVVAGRTAIAGTSEYNTSYADCAPIVAFVRVDDGDVTDVVYYVQD